MRRAGDLEEGVRILQLAVLRENVNAAALLGDLFRSGRGVPQNVSQAAQYYLIAANQGSASAQFVLASLYSQGSGVDEDAASAVS